VLYAVIVVGLRRGVVRPGISRAQALDWVAAALGECCAAAAEAGVRIALEPINRYETTLINNVAEGLELIDQVGADNLGLLFDTFHANIEEPCIEESLVAAGDRLFHVHVADSNRWHPGAGHVDFAKILDALRGNALGTPYGGFISGEFMPRPDAATAAQLAILHLRALERAAANAPSLEPGSAARLG
jgi:5-keto-L-gluconate epimerase